MKLGKRIVADAYNENTYLRGDLWHFEYAMIVRSVRYAGYDMVWNYVNDRVSGDINMI